MRSDIISRTIPISKKIIPFLSKTIALEFKTIEMREDLLHYILLIHDIAIDSVFFRNDSNNAVARLLILQQALSTDEKMKFCITMTSSLQSPFAGGLQVKSSEFYGGKRKYVKQLMIIFYLLATN